MHFKSKHIFLWSFILLSVLLLDTAQATHSSFSLVDYNEHLRIYDIQMGPILNENAARLKASQVWQQAFGTNDISWNIAYDDEYEAWLAEVSADQGIIMTRETGTVIALWNATHTDKAIAYIQDMNTQYIPEYVDCGRFDAATYADRRTNHEDRLVGAVTDAETAVLQGMEQLGEIYDIVVLKASYEVYYDDVQRVWLVRQTEPSGKSRCILLGRIYGKVLGWWEEMESL